MQFSIKHLFISIMCAAVTCLALVYASGLWATAIFSLCVLLLLASLVLCCSTIASRRAFWVGFAIFGWGYWGLLHSPILDLEPGVPNWRLQAQGPPLLTSAFLEWAYFNVLPLVHTQPTVDAMGNVTNHSRYPFGPEFMKVGHSIFALFSAVAGGFLGSIAYRRIGPPDEHSSQRGETGSEH